MSAIPLALTRDDVADYVSALFLVYIVLILINVLISWVPRMPYNRGAARGARLRHRDHRPLPQPLPAHPAADRRRRGFALDLSPIIAIIVLFVVRAVVVGLISG